MKGQHLGAWELVDRLDDGPYGVTWSAVDANGRHARLLLLPEAASGELMFERLRRGASRAAEVEHDAFVPVTEVAQTADGRLWLTMEPASGSTLDRLVRHRAMQFDDAIGLLHQLLDALSEAHQHGLVHRMLSLSCLELNEQGPKQLRIRDLWLANALTPELHLTLTGSANIGVPGFVAPEQVDGQVVDARTDLFAAGCIAFELLTGRPAVPGSSGADRLVNVLRGGVPRVSRLRAETPAWLDELVGQLLASNPSARPATAAEAIFVIDGKLSETANTTKPVEFVNQRVEVPRVETPAKPVGVFDEVRSPPNLARLSPRALMARPRLLWGLVALLSAGLMVELFVLRSRPTPPIEVPRRDGELSLTCTDCRWPIQARIKGPRSMTVTLPARIRLPVGTYEIARDEGMFVPVEVTLGPDEHLLLYYLSHSDRWTVTH
ncbi:MAG: serine/threonine protein kinase [Archangiaceae bacterium]|nr:serine/threonine protein kinase [Archangiaceae bacterium]